MSDTLEQAKDIINAAHSEGQKRAKRLKVPGGDTIFGIDELTALGQATALIAIAEQLQTLNATLHDATDLAGAIKVAVGQDLIDAIGFVE